MPGERKMERVGNQIVPGRKDVIQLLLPEPILLEPMYELHLDDGTKLPIVIENTTSTQGGSSVRAFIQP